MIPVLAIDPSLRSSGWATITTKTSGIEALDYGTITPKIPTRNRRKTRHLKGPERLAYIAANIRQLAQKHHTQLVAIEGYAHATTHSTHVIGELGGVIRTTLWGAHIPYLEIAPSTLKLWATGNGNADKNAMVAAAHQLAPWRGANNDEADAILLHALVADALGTPWTEPDHPRREEALAPITRTLAALELAPTETA